MYTILSYHAIAYHFILPSRARVPIPSVRVVAYNAAVAQATPVTGPIKRLPTTAAPKAAPLKLLLFFNHFDIVVVVVVVVS